MVDKFPRTKSRHDHLKTVSNILKEAETSKSRNTVFILGAILGALLGLVLLVSLGFFISDLVAQRSSPLDQEQAIIIEALIYRISVQQQVKMVIIQEQMMNTLGEEEILQKDYTQVKNWLINYDKASMEINPN